MIPAALQKHLDRLGATVTRVDGFTSRVHVPGAGAEFVFHSGGREGDDGSVTPPSVTRVSRHPGDGRAAYPEPWAVPAYDRLLSRHENYPDLAHDVGYVLGQVAHGGPYLADHPAGNGRYMTYSQELDNDGNLRHRVVLGNRSTGAFQSHDTYPGARDLPLHPDVAPLVKAATQHDPGAAEALFDAMEEKHAVPDHYARAYAGVVRYGLADRVDLGDGPVGRAVRGVKSAVKSLLTPRPDEPDVSGIRYRSRPDGRNFDFDNHLAAHQEIQALELALGRAGLLPRRGAYESREDHRARVTAAVADFLPDVRRHAHADTLGLGSHYYKTADQMRSVGDGSDPAPGERASLPSLRVGQFELAAALAPLVRKVAVDRGLRPGYRDPRTPPRPPADPGDVAEGTDRPAVDPDAVAPYEVVDPDEHAFDLLRAPTRVRAEEVRGPFGGGGPAPEHAPAGVDDFDLPGFEGGDDVVREVEAAPTYLTPEQHLAAAEEYLKNKKAKRRPLKLRDRLPRRKPAPPPDAPLAAPAGDLTPEEQVEAARRLNTGDDRPIKVRSRKPPKPLPRKPAPPPEPPLVFARVYAAAAARR